MNRAVPFTALKSNSNYPRNWETLYEVQDTATGRWEPYRADRDPWQVGTADSPPYSEDTITTLRSKDNPEIYCS